MALSTEELLRKAVLVATDGTAGAKAGTNGDFGGSGEAALSIEQVTQFIELMAAQQVMLSEAQTKTSSAAKWNESIIDMGGRIMKPGIEAQRLVEGQRRKPTTGLVEISTVLGRAEVPISDETLEDNVAGSGIVASIQRLIADQAGFDIEDLFVNGDTANGSDAWLALADGWLKQATNGKTGAGRATPNTFSAASYGKDYQAIFKKMLQSMPKRYLRNLKVNGRFYVPVTLEQGWRDILASRVGPLGDLSLTQSSDLTYQGVKIVPAPSFDAGIAAGSPDTCTILLSANSNLYAGYHRAMKFETFRDPREGATSFIITCRVDPEVAIIDATVTATSVDVELD
jgi:hypothetical protein